MNRRHNELLMRAKFARHTGHIVGQDGGFDLYRSWRLSFRRIPRNPGRPFGVPQGDRKAQCFRFWCRAAAALVAGCDFLADVLSWFSAVGWAANVAPLAAFS